MKVLLDLILLGVLELLEILGVFFRDKTDQGTSQGESVGSWIILNKLRSGELKNNPQNEDDPYLNDKHDIGPDW